MSRNHILIVSQAGNAISTNSLLAIGHRLLIEHAPEVMQVEIRRPNATPGNSIVVELLRDHANKTVERWSVEPCRPECQDNTTEGG
jgi:hypothetical protein